MTEEGESEWKRGAGMDPNDTCARETGQADIHRECLVVAYDKAGWV